MKFRYLTLLTLIASIIFLSCSNEDQFPQTHDVETENISKDAFIARPRSLDLIDDWLVWRDQHGGYFYSGFNTKERRLHRFARMGKSGKEYQTWPTVSPYGGSVGLFSHFKKFYQPWDIDSITSESYFPKVIPIKDSLNLALKVFMRPDSSFVSTGINPEGLFAFFNKDGSFNRVEGDYPYMKSGTDLKTHAIASLNSDIVYHPEKDKVIYGYLFAAQFVVYDLKDGNVTQDWAVDRWPFEYIAVDGNVGLTDKSRYGYVDFACNNDFIFALYANSPAGSDESTYTTIVEVYNWEGDRISKLKLDRPVCQIAVNQESTELFGMGVHEENISVLKAKLPVL